MTETTSPPKQFNARFHGNLTRPKVWQPSFSSILEQEATVRRLAILLLPPTVSAEMAASTSGQRQESSTKQVRVAGLRAS